MKWRASPDRHLGGSRRFRALTWRSGKLPAVSPRILNLAPTPLDRSPTVMAQALLAAARSRSVGDAEMSRLAGALHDISPAKLPTEAERLAFWLDLYNALLLHVRRLMPATGPLAKQLKAFSSVAWRIGPHAFTLDDIAHGLLRHDEKAPGSLSRSMDLEDPRRAWAPFRFDPRIHFALHRGTASCPVVRVYTPEQLDSQLDAATRDYLRQNSAVLPAENSVELPELCRVYSSDFGGRVMQVSFVARHLGGRDAEWLLARVAEVKVSYRPFDWNLVPMDT